jgi:hypothetical protein
MNRAAHEVKAMRNRTLLLLLVGLLFLAAPESALFAQSSSQKISYITYEEARPIVEALGDVLPAELRTPAARDLPSIWSGWVARRDAEIRARLIQGDEDSLVNLLLFGTSFTSKPRITLNDLAKTGAKQLFSVGNSSPEAVSFVKTMQSRADDLIRAMGAPGKNERLLFARELLQSKGYEISTPPARERVKQYLIASLARVLNEHASYARVLESAKLLGDPSAEFAERSKLYATRGLSSDTSLLPNFAIERALSSLKAQGLLATGSVRRIGIIGPGLDFTDKQDGYDFYPQQTIQPFAVIDTLLRLGLARTNELQVMTFDLSARVNDHLRRATTNARRSIAYTIQLPRDAQGQWRPEAIDYWARFGDRIATPVAPVEVPAGLGELKIRAVRVRAAVVALITPEDTNIVLQRVEVPKGQGFDLLIATNILVYYDVFEQSLALTNVERMLRPGGFLLSNNALLELPGSGMHSVGYETVVYSDKLSDGDHIVWYQRALDK